MTRTLWQQFCKHLDPTLSLLMVLLLSIGMAVLYSASGQGFLKLLGQGMNIIVALGAMWLIARVPPHVIEKIALWFYVLSLLMLIAVCFLGSIKNGAQRWLDLGIIQIQPSELMRIAMPMLLARYFSRLEQKPNHINFGVATLLLLIPTVLIGHQPDLGTALLVLASGFFVLFLAGLDKRLIIAGVFILIASVKIIWPLLHDYQRRRIEILLNPTQDPLGAGYHIIQSMIAIGSGGWYGKGWTHGTQSKLDFIPERTTDFIFAVFSEEFGLIGNVLLLSLLCLLVMRGLVIAKQARSIFSRLLAGGISLTLFTYTFVNMGMVSGILPVVGVPLPLISYGGTAMVTLCISLGILMSIQSHRHLVAT